MEEVEKLPKEIKEVGENQRKLSQENASLIYCCLRDLDEK